MAEQQIQKKTKKGKKKPEIRETPAVACVDKDMKKCVTLSSDTNKNPSNPTTPELLKEAVTCDKKGVTDDSTDKKKKKSKKKSKEVLKEKFAENNKSLLNFSENGIHLVNHPEISVTITDSPQPLDDEVKSVVDQISPFGEEKQNNNDTAVPVAASADTSNTTKKKKKKKKKNNNNNDTLPVVASASNEDTFASPSYTKVVTSDNTCVLVVNNEKFSVDTKLLENTESRKSKMPDNSINFSLTSENQLSNVLLTKNFTSDSNIQFSNSVSIFPVHTNGNSTLESQTETTANLETDLDAQTKAKDTSVPEIPDESKPTKSQLKAERRAKQEAQRAAKLAKANIKADNPTNTSNEKKNISPKEKVLTKENSSKANELAALPAKVPIEKESLHKFKLFSHLPQFKQFDSNKKIHPAILEIGFQYNKGIICGSNARCIALLEAIAEVIKDLTPQPDKNFCRELESNIQSCLSFLGNCRPLSVSMMNSVRFLKHEINQMPPDTKVEDIKERLCDFIYNFVKVNIVLAKEAIANRASKKIMDDDVILVLAFSSVVRDVLCMAHNQKKIFRVVVVDTRPKLEGLKMLRYLVKQGLQCSYISINAVSYIMKEVTKVFIGAHALLANGCVMSRLGNKQIALVASACGVPVFVCCETYKFYERVLTDSFVHNELGEPEDIINNVSQNSLKNLSDLPLLQPLNLLYDLTTPNFISEIVTEKGKQPCTSVAVSLKVKFAGLSR